MKNKRTAISHGMGALAASYVGTVVGAGFASGQEILQFFTAFGQRGFLGLAFTLVLFALFGARTLDIGRRLRAKSHRPLVHYANGPFVGAAIDWLLTLFLVGTTAAMASGAGATLFEQYGWHRWIGSSLLIVAAVGTVLAGVRGVVRSMAFVAPVLITTVLAISFVMITTEGGGLQAIFSWPGDDRFAPIPFWHVAALLYVGYNLILSVPVLAPLGGNARDKKAVVGGGIIGGIALGLGAIAIHSALAGTMPQAAHVDIPILYAARQLPFWVPPAYGLLLLAEIYTTAVGALFGFAARIGEEGGRKFVLATLAGALAAFVLGQFRFATIVGTFYPLMGGAGVILLIGLLRPQSRLGTPS